MVSISPQEIQVIAYIVILLILSAFFSGAETAFTALSPAKTELLVSEKQWAWKKIQYLMNRLDRCIMTCLIMSNLVNIVLSAYLTVLATNLFGIGKGLTAAIGLGTALILLFGEIIPKKVAIRYTVYFTQASAHILWGTMILLCPLTIPITRTIQWVWPEKVDANGGTALSVSEDEIRAMVSLGGKNGAIEKSSQEFLQKIFTLPEKTVREIMTPRDEITSLSDKSTLEDLLKTFETKHRSRIPIYAESLDQENIRLAYLPKMVPLLRNPKNLKKALKDLKLPNILVIPESLIIQDLLILFQHKRQHIALIVNEDQRTIGLITLEDILEVVFGEITDEKDMAIRHYVPRSHGKFEIDADISLSDFEEKTKQKLPEQFPLHKSLAWLAMEILHRFPKKGDHVIIPETDIVLCVLSVENKKAQTIEVRTSQKN
ncbi:MAG TPA: hemolysin family protein [Candidatus Gracilibacteria bacterium]